MKRFVQGVDRTQSILFPAQLEDYVAEDNPVRVIDAFVEAIDLAALGFDGMRSAEKSVCQRFVKLRNGGIDESST